MNSAIRLANHALCMLLLSKNGDYFSDSFTIRINILTLLCPRGVEATITPPPPPTDFSFFSWEWEELSFQTKFLAKVRSMNFGRVSSQ